MESSYAELSEFSWEADSAARDYANAILARLGCARRVTDTADPPVIAMVKSGMFGLSGHPGKTPLLPPAAVASAADGALLALKALGNGTTALPPTGAELLGERAKLNGFTRRAARSASGFCRLYRTGTVLLALNMARAEDRELLPAWLETAIHTESDIQRALQDRDCEELVSRGRLIGLALSHAADFAAVEEWAYSPMVRQSQPRRRPPRILDFSSLWAGPLASHLLQGLGADVVKVESPSRPDGARQGNAAFFDILNSAKRAVGIDFAQPDAGQLLTRLIDWADIVIEASRPRGLNQLGIYPEEIVQAKPDKIWLRISAYREPDAIGFGDEVAVASGTVRLMQQAWGEPLFVGDALADPLTGLHAAVLLQASWLHGRSGLWHVPMDRVVGYALTQTGAGRLSDMRRYQKVAESLGKASYPLRTAPCAAPSLGAHSREVLGQCP